MGKLAVDPKTREYGVVCRRMSGRPSRKLCRTNYRCGLQGFRGQSSTEQAVSQQVQIKGVTEGNWLKKGLSGLGIPCPKQRKTGLKREGERERDALRVMSQHAA